MSMSMKKTPPLPPPITSKIVQKLIEFFEISIGLEKKSGFSYVIGLPFPRIISSLHYYQQNQQCQQKTDSNISSFSTTHKQQQQQQQQQQQLNPLIHSIHFDERTKTLRLRMDPKQYTSAVTSALFFPPSSTSSSSSSSSNNNNSGSGGLQNMTTNSNQNEQSHNPLLLSNYLAMMDELTTWALVISDSERSRPGVSVNLTCHLGKQPLPFVTVPTPTTTSSTTNNNENEKIDHNSTTTTTMIEFVAKVTKIGRNLGFVRYTVLNVDENDANNDESKIIMGEEEEGPTTTTTTSNDQVICYGSHIKYLPMGFPLDFLLSKYGWSLIYFITQYILPYTKTKTKSIKTTSTKSSIAPVPSTNQTSTTTIGDDTNNNNINQYPNSFFESFEYQPQTKSALFHVNSSHASLGGPIHGGCQAVLMELLGTYIMKDLIRSGTTSGCMVPPENVQIQLDSISVDYISPPKSKYVKLVADVMKKEVTNNGCDVAVSFVISLVNAKEPTKIYSEGVLHYSTTSKRTAILPQSKM